MPDDVWCGQECSEGRTYQKWCALRAKGDKPLHLLLCADWTYWACRVCSAADKDPTFRLAYRRAWDHWWITHVKWDHP